MRHATDVDPEEERFLRDFEAPLAAIRERGAKCPEPSLIMGLRAGVLPEDLAAQVAGHVDGCSLCQTLARDLASDELSRPTPEESARIRRAVFAATGLDRRRPSFSLWSWSLRAVPAVAVLAVVIAGTVWLRRAGEQVAPPAPPPAVHARLDRHPALPLVKASVRLPLSAALVWRGQASPSGPRYLEDLGRALEPYRSDDFAEAARRLEALSSKYDEPEAHFYLGVSRLFLDRDAEALASLLEARRLAPSGPLAADVGWYLAIAYGRAGRYDALRSELRALCGAAGERQHDACAALQDH